MDIKHIAKATLVITTVGGAGLILLYVVLWLAASVLYRSSASAMTLNDLETAALNLNNCSVTALSETGAPLYSCTFNIRDQPPLVNVPEAEVKAQVRVEAEGAISLLNRYSCLFYSGYSVPGFPKSEMRCKGFTLSVDDLAETFKPWPIPLAEFNKRNCTITQVTPTLRPLQVTCGDKTIDLKGTWVLL